MNRNHISLTIEKIRLYNRWRRGDEEIPQPEPAEVGRLIDEVCDVVEEFREALEYIGACGLSARHLKDYAVEVLQKGGVSK